MPAFEDPHGRWCDFGEPGAALVPGGRCSIVQSRAVELVLLALFCYRVAKDGLGVKRELLINISDVKAICIECSSCHSQVRLAIDAKIRPDATALSTCPICESRFDSTLAMNIVSFQRSLTVVSSHTVVALQLDGDHPSL
jgi:hypothetical protein